MGFRRMNDLTKKKYSTNKSRWYILNIKEFFDIIKYYKIFNTFKIVQIKSSKE